MHEHDAAHRLIALAANLTRAREGLEGSRAALAARPRPSVHPNVRAVADYELRRALCHLRLALLVLAPDVRGAHAYLEAVDAGGELARLVATAMGGGRRMYVTD